VKFFAKLPDHPQEFSPEEERFLFHGSGVEPEPLELKRSKKFRKLIADCKEFKRAWLCSERRVTSSAELSPRGGLTFPINSKTSDAAE
jgi:hypothetical protein